MGQPGDEPYDPNAAYPSQQPYPGYEQPGYQQQQYPQQQYPQQPSYPQQYPQHGYAQPGYPVVPYPVAGYPVAAYPVPAYAMRLGPQRPGQATAAAVLGFVAGGLLIAAGILLFIGASIVDGLSQLNTNGHSLLSAELVVDGVLNLIAGGLLIAGAAIFNGGTSTGRILLSVGSGIVIALSIYWIARTGGAAVVYALLFGAIVIVALALAWTKAPTRWLGEMAKTAPRGA